ncbi:MAG: Hsp20/alpha crystallin family protein [Deltaproteobacteria bacterium]|jgi:HSP20 family protein|nr:Hsp20/alpha crystallin family protein [Deltaproteobacteria bacterium]
MTDTNNREINVKEKQPLDMGGVESTRGEARFSPEVDIYESEEGLTIIADMPGVTAEGLSVDLNDDILTIQGVALPEEPRNKYLVREYETGTYFRQFSLSELIDQEKITASIKDGVLSLKMPNKAPAQPRKITVVTD